MIRDQDCILVALFFIPNVVRIKQKELEMRTLDKTGLLAGNIVCSNPITGMTSATMSDDLENLSREQLMSRLKASATQPVISDNSMAGLLLSDANEVPQRYWKMMHPMTKLFCLAMASFWIFIAIFVMVKLF